MEKFNCIDPYRRPDPGGSSSSSKVPGDSGDHSGVVDAVSGEAEVVLLRLISAPGVWGSLSTWHAPLSGRGGLLVLFPETSNIQGCLYRWSEKRYTGTWSTWPLVRRKTHRNPMRKRKPSTESHSIRLDDQKHSLPRRSAKKTTCSRSEYGTASLHQYPD